MPLRFHWDCGLPNTATGKVAGKPFLASGLSGRASGQQATGDPVKRIQDTSALDSILVIITYDQNGGRLENVPVPPNYRPTRPPAGCGSAPAIHTQMQATTVFDTHP